MIIIPSSRTIEFLLGAAKTTNDCPFSTGAVDGDENVNPIGPLYTNAGNSNGTTAVTLAAAPASGLTRSLKSFQLFNADTVATTVKVRLNQGGTTYQLGEFVLSVKDCLQYSPEKGFFITDTFGNQKVGAPTIILPGTSFNNGANFFWQASSKPTVRPSSLGGGALVSEDRIRFQGKDWEWNGTYWLSVQDFECGVNEYSSQAGDGAAYVPLLYKPYNLFLLFWTGARAFGAVQDVNNYWTFKFRHHRRANANVDIVTFADKAYTPGDYHWIDNYDQGLLNSFYDCSQAAPNDVVGFDLVWNKTGTPGSWYGALGMAYKLAIP